MNEYKLINSKAIAEHCRKIKHKFNTEELAVLVYRNKYMSVDEKIQAYNELITHYPDMPVIERFNCRRYDSVRELIKSEINRLNALLDKLKLDESDVIYTYEAYYKSISMYRDYSKIANLYKTFSETITAVTEEITEDNDVLMFKLYKTSLIDDFPNIVAEYTVDTDKKVKMINIYDIEHRDLDIDNIFLNLPTPFKRGDILVSYGNVPAIDGVLPNKKEIFVLDWLYTWREDLKEKLAKENFDSSDMYGRGYFLYKNGDIANNLMVEEKYSYDSFEYYEDELQGNYRVLKGISSLLKDEIALMTFLDVYNQIRFEGLHSNIQLYTDEGLELAGLNKDDIKRLRSK